MDGSGTPPNPQIPGQPQQGGYFGPPQTPPQPQPLPQAPAQAQVPRPYPAQANQNIPIKPAWQVQAMQNVWSQSQQSTPAPTTVEIGQTSVQGAIPDQTARPTPSQPYQPYQAMPTNSPQSQQPIIGAPGIPTIPQNPQAGGVPPGYNPAPNSVFAAGPDPYALPQQGKGSGKMWLWMVGLLVLLAIAGLVGIFLVRQGQTPPANPADALQQALAATFKTQTYSEALSIKTSDNKTTNRSRLADFRKVGEPHLYVDNIAYASNPDSTEVTVIGNSYYAKKHIGAATLAKITDANQKQLITTGNDKWLLAIKDGKVVDDPTVAAMGVVGDLMAMRIIVPSPLPVGYFRDTDQKQLADYVSQNQIYTAANNSPSSENINNQDTWKFDVNVDKNKVQDLNVKIAGIIGSKNTDSITEDIKAQTPDKMQVWVRKSDNRVVQYSYEKDKTTYTYRYDKLDQQLEVSAPGQNSNSTSTNSPSNNASNTNNAAANLSDDDIKAAANDIFTAMTNYQDQGNVLPNNQKGLDEFTSQRLDANITSKFKLIYTHDIPSQKGVINLQVESSCSDDGQSFAGGEDLSSFALLAKLSGTLYCVSN